MVAPSKLNFKIYQGSTFSEILRWESSTKIYKPIAGIIKAAPMVVQSVSHGIPAGWRVKITNVVGMTEVNSSDYKTATEVTTDSVIFNDINSLGYKEYTSGGVLEYNEPNSLAGYTARMHIREKVTSTTTLDELTTENGGITIDDSGKTITLSITATDTAAYTFKTAVYSIELISGATVIPFVYGNLTLETEITR